MAKGKLRSVRAPEAVWAEIDRQAIAAGLSSNAVAVAMLSGPRARARATPSPPRIPDEDPGEVIGDIILHVPTAAGRGER